jgi:hypothetical protein
MAVSSQPKLLLTENGGYKLDATVLLTQGRWERIALSG